MAQRILIEDEFGNQLSVTQKAFDAGVYPGMKPVDVIDGGTDPIPRRGALLESDSGYIGDSPTSGRSLPAHEPTPPELAPQLSSDVAVVTREGAAALSSVDGTELAPTGGAAGDGTSLDVQGAAGGGVSGSSTIDPASLTVQQVLDHVRTYPGEWSSVLELERAGKNRSTLVVALEKPSLDTSQG